MNNLAKDEVKKAVDTVIGNTQLFTPSLKEKIHNKAISQSQSKRKLSNLFPKVLSVGIVMAMLMFIITIIDDKRELDLSAIETNEIATDDLNVQQELSENVRKEIANYIQSNLNIMLEYNELEARHLAWIENFSIVNEDETLVKALPAMKNLKSLSVNVPFKELSIIESLKLQDLSISSNENLLSEIDFQKMQELQNLTLSNNKLQTIDQLTLPPNLKNLDLAYNNISDLSQLDLPASIEGLNLSQNKIFSLPELNHLKELQNLYLSKNKISNEEMAKVTNLTNLQILSISENTLTDLNFVLDFPNLIALDISKTGITDIGNLKNLKSLASLNIKDTEIQSILPLLEMKTLNFIVLDKSVVKDWELLEAYVTDSLTAEF